MIIRGQTGYSGGQRVFLGFAPASVLCGISYADVLDEQTGAGYQRRIAREHSLAFKRYIQTEGATTIPLTFNLRQTRASAWELVEAPDGSATLTVDASAGRVLTQVDGQHRLGFLQDSPVVFSFMSFIGLSEGQEMEVFRTINGKAKGLSSSLLDYTGAKALGSDLAEVDPALFVALGLNREGESPWCGRLDLGGGNTVGPKRIASLRTMHQAAQRMLKAAQVGDKVDASAWLERSIAFWQAVVLVLSEQWAAPRQHMLCKGIGVYALMSLAGHLVREAGNRPLTVDYFLAKLSDFLDQIDWTNHGPLEGFGGSKGADMALRMILEVRKDIHTRLSQHA
ncbi:DGQHR domain-containing protein [Variovorax sp. GB1R11]|uniref:DGQHR domain-containing protein n=1 Tax=Variovorax sp. GB1R11 TaxID=3443741 RepID=UPI003F485ABB